MISPSIYDAFVGLQDLRGLRRQRRRVGTAATGTVLEVGVGTGRNLPYYTGASRVVGIDPSERMLDRAARRSTHAPCPFAPAVGDGADLPFPAAHFDTVVMSLILCSIPNPETAVEEAHRVLKPGGRLVFLEHERSPDDTIARIQDAITPAWSQIAGGCHLNRPTTNTIRRLGFEITTLWRSRQGKGSLVQGVARRV